MPPKKRGSKRAKPKPKPKPISAASPSTREPDLRADYTQLMGKIKILEDKLSRDPKSVIIHNNLALAHSKAFNSTCVAEEMDMHAQKAIDYVLKVPDLNRELFPKSMEIALNNANILFDYSKYSEALDECRRGLSIKNPEEGNALIGELQKLKTKALSKKPDILQQKRNVLKQKVEENLKDYDANIDSIAAELSARDATDEKNIKKRGKKGMAKVDMPESKVDMPESKGESDPDEVEVAALPDELGKKPITCSSQGQVFLPKPPPLAYIQNLLYDRKRLSVFANISQKSEQPENKSKNPTITRHWCAVEVFPPNSSTQKLPSSEDLYDFIDSALFDQKKRVPVIAKSVLFDRKMLPVTAEIILSDQNLLPKDVGICPKESEEAVKKVA